MRILVAPVQCASCGESISAEDYYCPRCGSSTLRRPIWRYVFGLVAVAAGVLWQVGPPWLHGALADLRAALGL